jgi:uncharacterized membrane protein
MNKYEIYLWAHIAAVVVWLGGGLTLSILGARVARTDDPVRAAAFTRDVEWAGMRLFTPAALLALVFGLLLVQEGPWSFDELWIDLGLAGFAITFVLGFFFLGPESGRLAKLIEAEGAKTPAVRAGIRRILFVSRLDLGSLYAIVWIMAVKPTAGDEGALAVAAAIPAVAAVVAYMLYQADGRRPVEVPA